MSGQDKRGQGKRVRRRTVVILSLLALVIAAGVAVGIWRLTQFSPEEVDLDTAVESAREALAESGDAANDTGTTSAETDAEPDNDNADAAEQLLGASPLDGEWIVDNSIGTFTYESATGSFAGFRVEEELLRLGNTTAVGRTGEVIGAFRISDTTLVAAEFTVDLATITTNDSRRDRLVYSALGTDEYPLATFVLTQHVELGDIANSAEPSYSGTAVGELTIKGATVPTEFQLSAQLVDDLAEDGVIVLVGSADIVFADFGVTVPSAPIVAHADDFGVVEVQLLLRQAG